MSVYEVKVFLLASIAIHYAILLIWFGAFVFRHEWLLGLHRRWFDIPAQRFDAIHYGAMSVYKIGILLLNAVPLLALIVVGK